MPGKIERRLFDGPEHAIDMVLPGDILSMVLKRQARPGRLLLAACDLDDFCTDIFYTSLPDGFRSLDAASKQATVGSMVERQKPYKSLRDGVEAAFDLKELGVSELPSVLIVRHDIEMTPDTYRHKRV